MLSSGKKRLYHADAMKNGRSDGFSPVHPEVNRCALGPCYCYLGFPRGASVKEPACQWGRHKRREFSPWVGTTPWRRGWPPTLVFLPGESHGQRSLAGYSPWGCKESDATEWLTLSFGEWFFRPHCVHSRPHCPLVWLHFLCIGGNWEWSVTDLLEKDTRASF